MAGSIHEPVLWVCRVFKLGVCVCPCVSILYVLYSCIFSVHVVDRSSASSSGSRGFASWLRSTG